MKHYGLILILPLLLLGRTVSGMPLAKESTEHGFEEKRPCLVGKWLGVAPLDGGGRRVWLNHRFADGTYVVTFFAVRGGECTAVGSEYGDWGLSGNIYFTMTRGQGPEVPAVFQRAERGSYEDDAYRVTKLTARKFRYTSVATGRSYVTRKVADDYEVSEATLPIR